MPIPVSSPLSIVVGVRRYKLLKNTSVMLWLYVANEIDGFFFRKRIGPASNLALTKKCFLQSSDCWFTMRTTGCLS